MTHLVILDGEVDTPRHTGGPRMKSINKSIPLAMGLLTSLSIFGLSGCEQNYKITTTSDSTFIKKNPKINIPTNITSEIPTTFTTSPNSLFTTEVFNAANTQIKKIDFLFVIDNSKSMSDNQRKLAQGFQAFANTFFRRSDLDICTMIITSDRYLGKENGEGYLRERSLPCTKPAGSENWTDEQTQDHINSLISEFKQNVYVGTDGSSAELLGKSLVSFLNETNHSAFFRKDAVANISFITDENNYYFDGPSTPESKNDLSASVIKENLDGFFKNLNPDRELSYSTTSILQLNSAPSLIPGISVNLSELASAVGRESKQSNIAGSTKSYTDVYQSIADAIVLRATVFTLAHPFEQNQIKVQLVRKNNEKINLLFLKDFILQSSNTLTLNPSVVPLLTGDAQIEVTYRYSR